jgi:hypothetical protein
MVGWTHKQRQQGKLTNGRIGSSSIAGLTEKTVTACHVSNGKSGENHWQEGQLTNGSMTADQWRDGQLTNRNNGQDSLPMSGVLYHWQDSGGTA